MQEPRSVANPPERPLAIFDGDCDFCRLWIGRWKSMTGQKVDYAPSQEVASRFPEIPPEAFAGAVQLVTPDGRVLQGAEAVFATLAAAPGGGELLRIYRRVPGFAACVDFLYRQIANHRRAAMAVTRLLWGRSVARPSYLGASALFLRLLGLSYLAAFVSLWVQVDGLIGSNGILPIARYLEWVRENTGSERYWLLPTLCWLSSSDGFLQLLCGGGTLAALALILGFAPALSLSVAWLSYLSLSIAGQVFLEFQWDSLLLEAGLLAIFLVSPGRLRLRTAVAASPLVLFLLRWLFFRLMISSGWVKLASGDPTWRDLTALAHHYQTQPLPPWTAWYVHQLPPWFQTVSVLFVFAVELAVPFLFFAPRRLRLFACGATILSQALIAATGNYAFFNLLTIALAVLLIDDQALPGRWRRTVSTESPRNGWPAGILAPIAIVLLLASTLQFAATLRRTLSLPSPLSRVVHTVEAFRGANRYGLFSIMTTSRPEIQIEGSDDGLFWHAYEFRWKPGDPLRRPRFVAPHQPRLDWQMWFAALGSYEQNPWLMQFLGRLLEGSPEVERLLARQPFAGRPPRLVRAVVYEYRFSTIVERRSTGAWWIREPKGLYCPVLTREGS